MKDLNISCKAPIITTHLPHLQCTTCLEFKDQGEFHINRRKTVDSVIGRGGICKTVSAPKESQPIGDVKNVTNLKN